MFPKRLNEVRKAKGISAQKMADELYINVRGYRRYESGDTTPPLYTALKIADILGVSLDYLLGRTNNKEVDH